MNKDLWTNYNKENSAYDVTIIKCFLKSQVLGYDTNKNEIKNINSFNNKMKDINAVWKFRENVRWPTSEV